MGNFITCSYPSLLPLALPDYRMVSEIPPSGKFLLMREITGSEYQLLTSIYSEDFVVVTVRYGADDWDRDILMDRIKKLRKSRKRPKYKHLSSGVFIERVKEFYVTNEWRDTALDDNLFDLYSNIDSVKRYDLLFRLLERYHPNVIVASLLTFVGKCLYPERASGATHAYRRVIKAKSRRIVPNALPAVAAYIESPMDDRTKCLMFIQKLGG